MMRHALFAAAALLVSSQAQAQLIQERTVSLAAAQALALAAVEACAARNLAVTATVVDRSGIVRAMLRADRARPHTIGASSRQDCGQDVRAFRALCWFGARSFGTPRVRRFATAP